jgi:hypothetical protein
VQNELTQMGAHPQAAHPGVVNRLAALSARVSAVVLLGLAFFLAPALQGINLEANQANGANAVTRAADSAASAEVLRLTQAG